MNRDPDNAMRTETGTETQIDLKPAFNYVDDILNPKATANVLNALNDLSTEPGAFFERIFSGLFGGKTDKGKEKQEGNASQPAGDKKPTAAEQALQELGSDPMDFLYESLANMFANPSGKKDVPATPMSGTGK